MEMVQVPGVEHLVLELGVMVRGRGEPGLELGVVETITEYGVAVMVEALELGILAVVPALGQRQAGREELERSLGVAQAMVQVHGVEHPVRELGVMERGREVQGLGLGIVELLVEVVEIVELGVMVQVPALGQLQKAQEEQEQSLGVERVMVQVHGVARQGLELGVMVQGLGVQELGLGAMVQIMEYGRVVMVEIILAPGILAVIPVLG